MAKTEFVEERNQTQSRTFPRVGGSGQSTEPGSRPNWDILIELALIETAVRFLDDELRMPGSKFLRCCRWIIVAPTRVSTGYVPELSHDAVGGNNVGSRSDQVTVGLERQLNPLLESNLRLPAMLPTEPADVGHRVFWLVIRRRLCAELYKLQSPHSLSYRRYHLT